MKSRFVLYLFSNLVYFADYYFFLSKKTYSTCVTATAFQFINSLHLLALSFLPKTVDFLSIKYVSKLSLLNLLGATAFYSSVQKILAKRFNKFYNH